MNDEIQLFLERAREDWLFAENVYRTPYPQRAASPAYYAMFHAAEALLLSIGIETKSHAATKAAFGKHFAKAGRLDSKFHRYLVDGFDARITADYDVTITVKLETVEEMIGQAREFVEAAERYLQPPPP